MDKEKERKLQVLDAYAERIIRSEKPIVEIDIDGVLHELTGSHAKAYASGIKTVTKIVNSKIELEWMEEEEGAPDV